MKKRIMLAVAMLLACAVLLAGCGGEPEPLPDGVGEEELLSAGQEIVDTLISGDYQAVYDQFREDIRVELSEESVRDLAAPVLEEAGSFEGVDETSTAGSTEGESHAIARFICAFSQEDVEFRVAFDPELTLIGLSVGIYSSGWSFSNLISNVTGLFGG